ncbi:hypothetical protein Sjap_010353 [Stephania japonica]|uniref:Cyclin-like domain-containing protein n=1 Tax=Stephania japonica TaxID=461633 RepID=A0AAP0P720_9MAGN
MAARTPCSCYVSRKQIEEDSPSRRDGIALLENALRKSYCNFLLELGSELSLPERTIATATLYCHRFFLLKSHKKYDEWQTIAVGCMKMACRVERTPLHSEKDLVIASYEIFRKYNPTRISVTKEMIDEGVNKVSRVDELVLITLDGFDIYVSHPYKPLHNTLMKFQGPSKDEFYQHAMNVAKETWLKTSLCLQYKPEHIAGAAIYLAIQRFKASVHYYGKEWWWDEFDIHPLLGYPRLNTANLHNRSDPEEQVEFMQWLNLPDEPELKCSEGKQQLVFGCHTTHFQGELIFDANACEKKRN